jgi:hypothetical protein
LHTVENCEHFDGHTCSKCGRMLPAYCKDQEILEEKARKFDELMSAKKEPETTEDLVDEPVKEAPVAPKAAPVTKGVPVPKATPKR